MPGLFCMDGGGFALVPQVNHRRPGIDFVDKDEIALDCKRAYTSYSSPWR